MVISRAWNYILLIGATLCIAGYLYHQKSPNLKEYIGMMIFLWSYYYLTKGPKASSLRNKNSHYESNLSYAIDDLQSEKRFLPKQYRKLKNKLKNKVKRSFSKMKQKLGLKQQNWARGDGLHSIFSAGATFHHSDNAHARLVVDLNDVRSKILDADQSMAFDALFTLGIFEGAETSMLNELCSNATLLTKKRGQYLVKHEATDANDFLYVLKSGTCSVIFPAPTPFCEKGSMGNACDLTHTSSDEDEVAHNEECDAAGDVVLSITAGRVVASVADVLAWLIRSDTPRKISLRCSEDCVVVAIPSPRAHREGKGVVEGYQSRLHMTSFARIARMLLIRLNRTTCTTALFYLGLAEHMVPRLPPTPVPPRLQQICALASTGGKLNNLDKSDYPECVQLVRELVGSFLGIEASAVQLPEGSEESRGEGVAEEGGDGNVDELSFIPPPIAYSRTKSFDSLVGSDIAIQAGGVSKPASSIFSDKTRSRASSLGLQTLTGLRFMAAGQTLLDVEETPGLYVIVCGRVSVLFTGHTPHMRCSAEPSSSTPSFLSRHRFIAPTVFSDGDCLGHIALLAGDSTEWHGQQKQGSIRHPLLKVEALTDTWLLKVSMFTYEDALINHPEVTFHFNNRMITALPPMIRLFDFCTKWVNLKGGDDVVKQGEESRGRLYIVLFGTLLCLVNETPQSSTEDLSSPHEDDGNDNSGEDNATDGSHMRRDDEASSGYSQLGGGKEGYTFGRGTLIGDTQLLTGAPYKHTVRAIRQTALSEVPEALLEYLALHYPSILTHIARNVSHKQQIEQKYSRDPSDPVTAGVMSKSIVVTPVTGSVPLDLVCSTLKTCLGHCANKVQLITSADAAAVFGGVLDGLSEYELILTVGSWMHQIELDNDIVLYQADWQLSAWTRLCIMNCDEILLVANSLDSHEIDPSERWLHSHSSLVPKTLVMLYTNPAPDLKPSGTLNWIECREGAVDRHVHVRLHSNNQIHDTISYRSDFNRLARILTNTAVGVVLGGGGARGLSHLGVLQALEDRHIPVDIIGGTSIGSFVGGLYAFENSISTVNPIAKSWAKKMNSYWFYLQDLTLPITSYFNGHNFTSSIRQVFERRKIEDMWLNYYCVTTDLTSHTERVHVNGTASRYIRASMSLANFLPPLCDVDPVDRKCHYLVDGGYVNTVPIDVMRKRFGAKIIIAVDVSGDWNMEANHSYGDSLNGLSVWASRWNPFSEKIQNVPTMADIANQLAFVSACRQVERVKGLADLYLLPPVRGYSTLEFGALDTLKNIGLTFGGEEIDKWLLRFDPGEGFKSAWFQSGGGHRGGGGEMRRDGSGLSLRNLGHDGRHDGTARFA